MTSPKRDHPGYTTDLDSLALLHLDNRLCITPLYNASKGSSVSMYKKVQVGKILIPHLHCIKLTEIQWGSEYRAPDTRNI